MSDHEQYMQKALLLAKRGWGKVSPNPMVGAVVVKSGKVVSQGWHEVYGGPHAEAMALSKAGAKAHGADLYVTLEPCRHFGKTPPCTDAILKAGIKRVFVGVKDPNPAMNAASLKLLQKAGITVEVGFLEADLQRLNESFAKFITTGLPFVTAKIAQTLDGKVATNSGDSQWITSASTRQHTHQLRFGFDAIMVGIRTVLRDNPRLNAEGKRIKKVILDTHLKTPPKANIFAGIDPKDVLIFTGAARQHRLPAEVVPAPLKAGLIDLKWVLKNLGERGVANLLIEGGPTVIGQALAQKLVDKMTITMAPKILGEGKSAVAGMSFAKISQALLLQDVSVQKSGVDIVIEGYL